MPSNSVTLDSQTLWRRLVSQIHTLELVILHLYHDIYLIDLSDTILHVPWTDSGKGVYDSKSGCLIYKLCILKPHFHEAKIYAETKYIYTVSLNVISNFPGLIVDRNSRIPPLPRGYPKAPTLVIKTMLNLNLFSRFHIFCITLNAMPACHASFGRPASSTRTSRVYFQCCWNGNNVRSLLSLFEWSVLSTMIGFP